MVGGGGGGRGGGGGVLTSQSLICLLPTWGYDKGYVHP